MSDDNLLKSYKSENGSLVIDIEELPEIVTVKFVGQSVEMQPGQFLSPIFEKHVLNNDKDIVMDFVHLRSLTSPTLGPVIQVLNRASEGSRKVKVIYNSDFDWQETTFTAFKVYEKSDQVVIASQPST